MFSTFTRTTKKAPQSPRHVRFNPTFYNPFEVKHRRRTSTAQLKVLEESFRENAKPTSTTRRILAEQLDMTPHGVQTWFQNRRAKDKLQRRRQDAAAEALSDRHTSNSCTMASPPQFHLHMNAPRSVPDDLSLLPCIQHHDDNYNDSGKLIPDMPVHKRENFWDFIPMENTQLMAWSAVSSTSNAGLVEQPFWSQQQEPSRRYSCFEATTMSESPESENLSYYYYHMTAAAAAAAAMNDPNVFMPRRQSEGDVQRVNHIDFSIDDLRLDYSSVSTVSVVGSPMPLDYLTTTAATIASPDSLFLQQHDLFRPYPAYSSSHMLSGK